MKRVLLASAAVLLSLPVFAADPVKDYPVRPVRLINPFPPGGSSNPSCRLVFERAGTMELNLVYHPAVH